MRPSLVLLLLACVLPACAAERLEEFAYAALLETDGREALQRLEIPQAVYEGSVRPRLGDVRVLNGRGEMVPFAFLPRPVPAEAKAPAVALRFFPLYGSSTRSVQDLDIRTEVSKDGTVVRVSSVHGAGSNPQTLLAYLVDASGHKVPLETLELDWKPIANGFSGILRIEGSDDLAHWTTLVSAAPLLSLDYGGQQLEQKSADLPGARYRYLRLSWPAAQPSLSLTAVAGRPGKAQIEPARRWKALTVTAGKKPGEYLFDLGGHLPLDRLRVELPEPNTLASVEVLAREREEDAWHAIAGAVVYRLTRDGAEVASAPIPLSGGNPRYWLLRVDQKGGGIGSGLPKVQAGWVPEQLVFVARGSPPFQLVYGNGQAQAGAYPIQTVVPGWRMDEPVKAGQARVGEQREVAGSAALREPIDHRTWMLWGALGLGVAILAWMAWQLARQMRSGAAH